MFKNKLEKMADTIFSKSISDELRGVPDSPLNSHTPRNPPYHTRKPHTSQERLHLSVYFSPQCTFCSKLQDLLFRGIWRIQIQISSAVCTDSSPLSAERKIHFENIVEGRGGEKLNGIMNQLATRSPRGRISRGIHGLKVSLGPAMPCPQGRNQTVTAAQGSQESQL
jgi:hypothetical protein